MAKYTAIESDLVAALTRLGRKLRGFPAKEGNWTREVIHCVATRARQFDCHPCAHGCDRGEFLCDLVWLKIGNQGLVEDIPLAVECEWGNDNDVAEDFDKLLIVRADHRLMIFDGANIQNADKLIERLGERIRRFAKTRRGDRCLYARWQDDEFKFSQYVA